jgi:GxxExxY protein
LGKDDSAVHGSVANDPETYALIGAAMEVHGQLGHGFLEPVYQDALTIELAQRGVQFESEVEIPVLYKGASLPSRYRADFVVSTPSLWN